MNIGQLISLIYLGSGLILFVLAVMILRENAANRLNRTVSLMLSLAGIAPLASALYQSLLEGSAGIPSWFVNTYYIWELFFPALLYFSAIFPEPQPIYINHKKLLQLAFVPHLLHLLMVLLLADPDKVIGMLTFESSVPVLGQLLTLIAGVLKILTAFLGFLLLIHTRFFSLVNLLYVVSAVYLLQSGYRIIQNPRLKQQVKLVIYGVLIAVGLYVVGFLIPDILSFRISSSLRDLMAVAALIVGPGTIAWAIVRYQFLDIGLIARRSLAYSITTAIVVGGYLLVVVELGSAIRSVVGKDSPALNILIVIVLLLFFQPIYNQVDDFVRKIFIRTRGDYSQMVESFSREILTIFQADKLTATVADTLRREMFIEYAEISFPERDGAFLLSVTGQARASFKLEPEISIFLLAKRAPTFVEEFASRVERGRLGHELIVRGVQITVPLIRQDQLAGLLLLSAKVAGFRYNSEDLTFLNILANHILVAMENAELYAEALEKQRLEEELAVAKQIQTGLLPKALPPTRHFEFATYIEPSRQVGGDFYDFIHIHDGRLGIVIADASGKGVPAALLIARMQAVIQSEARLGKGVDAIMTSVNLFISQSLSPDRFATCFYAELDDHKKTMYYCNAGHNYPLLVRKGGQVIALETGGLLLGAFADARYESGRVEFFPGDMILLYTDGLTEMMDINEVEFGEKRLIERALEVRHNSVEAICSQIVKSVKQHGSGINEIDDMTLVVVKALESAHGVS